MRFLVATVEEMGGVEPFAHQPALHVGGGDQHGVDLARVERCAEVI